MIYLDNAATTRVYREVFYAMSPYYLFEYGNPSANYSFAEHASMAVNEAREKIACALGAKKNEIYFTAGGSESDNWALKVIAASRKKKGMHIITSKIEHHAILHTAKYLEDQGYEITYLPVDQYGMVSLDSLKKAIRSDTILISIMMANNEVGTIQPIKEIGRIAKDAGVLFHTDAVQTFGHLKINVNDMNIDLLSASAHKFNGPKGVGFLYAREGTDIDSFIHGGSQERQKRAGTLNVPGIVGLGKATEIAMKDMDRNQKKEKELRDYLIKRIMQEIPYVIQTGHPVDRLTNNASFCIRFVEGSSLLIELDQRGICASSGSACTAESTKPSHVLLAMGVPYDIAHGSLRLTLSSQTSKRDIDMAVYHIKESVRKLRGMSPLYETFVLDNNSRLISEEVCDKLSTWE